MQVGVQTKRETTTVALQPRAAVACIWTCLQLVEGPNIGAANLADDHSGGEALSVRCIWDAEGKK